MKQLRQSLEAKKKKKRRPSAPGEYNDELTQELRELQVDMEMNEKLQKWLHKVASNATHLSDTDVAGHLSSTSSAANLVSAAPANSSLATGGGGGASGLGGMYDRVRRRPVTAMGGAAAGSTLGVDLARTSSSFARGGARKKDSAYQLSMDEYCLLAKSYESDKKAAATIVSEDRFATTTTTKSATATTSSSSADDESAERLKKRRESSQFEERLLTQFYDNSSPQCENFFRAFATTSAAEGAAILKEGSGGGAMAGGGTTGPTAATAGGGERVSKFKWRFHGDGAISGGGAGQGAASRGGDDGDVATAGVSPKATEADMFLNSLLMKRNHSSNIQRFTSSSFGAATAAAAEDYVGSGGRRWSDRLVMSRDVDDRERPTKQKEERDLEQAWRDVLKEEAAAMDVRAVMVDDLVVLRQEQPSEVETVIIEKAVEAEDELLSAACREILNDPGAAFDEEDEEDPEGEQERYELIDLMTFDTGSEGELAAKLAGDDEEEEEDDDEDEDDDDVESCLGHVLMYEDEDRGEVTFLGGGDENEREVCGGRDTGIRRISTTREDRDRAVFPGFMPFDESYDEEEDDDDEEEEGEDKLGSW